MSDNTLAARPVGANNISFCPRRPRAFTMTLAMVVLPVPADPLSTITAFGERSAKKRAKVARALRWSSVGAKSRFRNI